MAPVIHIQTYCGSWGAFEGQVPTPVLRGSIWDCIAFRASRASVPDGRRTENRQSEGKGDPVGRGIGSARLARAAETQAFLMRLLDAWDEGQSRGGKS